MTGFAVSNLDIPIVKGSSGIVVFPPEMVSNPNNFLPCVKCGKCAEVCPMYFVPSMIGYYAEKKRYRDAEEFGIFNCISNARRPWLSTQKAREVLGYRPTGTVESLFGELPPAEDLTPEDFAWMHGVLEKGPERSA